MFTCLIKIFNKSKFRHEYRWFVIYTLLQIFCFILQKSRISISLKNNFSLLNSYASLYFYYICGSNLKLFLVGGCDRMNHPLSESSNSSNSLIIYDPTRMGCHYWIGLLWLLSSVGLDSRNEVTSGMGSRNIDAWHTGWWTGCKKILSKR